MDSIYKNQAWYDAAYKTFRKHILISLFQQLKPIVIIIIIILKHIDCNNTRR